MINITFDFQSNLFSIDVSLYQALLFFLFNILFHLACRGNSCTVFNFEGDTFMKMALLLDKVGARGLDASTHTSC